MRMQQHPLGRALLRRTAPMLGAGAGWLTLAILRAMRLANRRRGADFWARLHAPPRPAAAGASHRPRQSGGRLSGQAARRDRADPRRRVGQSRPLRGGVRADRPPDQLRSEPAGGRRGGGCRHLGTLSAAAPRRQAGADLRGASRQLGAAGPGGGPARSRYRGAVSPAQHPRGQRRGLENPRRRHGHAGGDRPRRAGPAPARARGRRARRPCWPTSISSKASTSCSSAGPPRPIR